ncbi:hypothetical protein [Amycolatopsis magusensis]
MSMIGVSTAAATGNAAAQAESFGSMGAGFTTTIGTAIVRLCLK